MVFNRFKFSSYIPVFVGFVLTLSIGLTVVVLQQQQESRSRAATEGGSTCREVCYSTCAKICDNPLTNPVCLGSCAYGCSSRCTGGAQSHGLSNVGNQVPLGGSGGSQPSACQAKKGTCMAVASASNPNPAGTCNGTFEDLCGDPRASLCCVPVTGGGGGGGSGGGGGGGGSSDGQCGQHGCCNNPATVTRLTSYKNAPVASCRDKRVYKCPDNRWVPSNVWLCPGDNNIVCCVPITSTTTAKTQLAIPKAFLHIIGKAGDSVKEGEAGGGNMSPVHNTRDIVINIADSNGNAKVTNKKATLTFDKTTGALKTNAPIDLGSLATGIYDISIKMPMSLPLTIDNVAITNGQTKDLPIFYLVTGDVDDNGKLDLLDWGILIGCFSDIGSPASCTDAKKLQSDITDDGKVDNPDLNVFIRECKVKC